MEHQYVAKSRLECLNVQNLLVTLNVPYTAKCKLDGDDKRGHLIVFTPIDTTAAELLAACKDFVDAWQNQRNDSIDDSFDAIVEAIAKAEELK